MMFILRLFFGINFVLSGFFKVVDPVGTGLIVEEYLNAMHLGFLRFGALPFGILLSILELVIGISMLMGVRMKVVSWAALVMTGFFTVLTFITAVFGLVADCGCFGEAIKFSPWGTFFKNIVLMCCIIPIFLYRNRFKLVAPTYAAWSFLGTYALVALGFALYSYFTLPLGDFGDFRAGSNISEKYDNVTDGANYTTRFVYSKDGQTKLFALDSIPDATWTYVSTETVYEGDEHDLLFDMTLTDADGRIISENIIHSDMPVYIAVVHRPGKKNAAYWERLVDARDAVARHGGLFFVAVPAPHKSLEILQAKYPSFPIIVYGDYKTLVAMARSNGAVLYLDDGMVVKKWPAQQFGKEAVEVAMSQDSEELMAQGTIYRRLFYEMTVLLMILILVIFRYICGVLYGRKYANMYMMEAARRRELRKARRIAKMEARKEAGRKRNA